MRTEDNQVAPDSVLQQRLQAAGLSWGMLCNRCCQIVLFGSRAANVHTNDSDFDLLCVVSNEDVVTRHDQRVTPGIDLVWISQSRLRTPEWLGSELAQHIAKYGRWLHGADNWTGSVFSSRQAVIKKAFQINERMETLLPRWERLLSPYRRKYSRLVRRDLQRLQMLTRGEAVPPSTILDRLWQDVIESPVKWAEANLEPGLVDLKLLARLEWKERGPTTVNKENSKIIRELV